MVPLGQLSETGMARHISSIASHLLVLVVLAGCYGTDVVSMGPGSGGDWSSDTGVWGGSGDQDGTNDGGDPTGDALDGNDDSQFDWSDLSAPDAHDAVVLVEEHPCFESISETYEDHLEELIAEFTCDPANVGLDVGDVIVGTSNGGYLREITAMEVSGYTVVFQTVQASLAQVMADGGFYEDLEFDEARYVADFSGTSLYSGTHGGANVNVSLSEGVIDMRPRLRLGAEFGWFTLKRADAILDLDIEADLELMAQISDSVSVDGDIGLGTWQYPFAFAAGPIPVTGTLQVSLTAGFETGAEAQATATVGAEADADIRVGGRYRNGSWYYVQSTDFDAHRTGPDFDVQGDWNGKVWVRAEAKVMLYRVAGPSFGVKPFLRGEAHAECSDLDWSFYAGASADAGLHLDVFVFETSRSFGPWTWETNIGEGTIELPFPLGTDCPGAPTPCPEPVGTISCGQTVSGDTSVDADGVASMNAYPVNVGNYEAPEVVYEWVGGGGSEVEFKFVDAQPTQINHDIMLIEGECRSDNATDWGLNSFMTEAGGGGGPKYIVVDGYDGDSGAFQLTLDCDP